MLPTFSLRFCLPFLATILCCLVLAGTAAAQEQWEIRPSYQYTKTTITVAPFNTANTSIDQEAISRIIRNDLVLSGFFQMPKDQLMANRQNMIDHRNRQINFEFWRDTMNVDHYVMGEVKEENGNLNVRVVMYDIASQRVILNRNFVYPKQRMRFLAHSISDEIILLLKGVEGVCRTKILFVTEQVPGVKEIAVMDWDGFNVRPLTSFGKLAVGPSWGANGTEMYFTSYHGNRANIYGMQLVPDAALNFTPGPTWTIAAYGGTNHSPSWNPAVRRVVMVLSKDGNSEIYTAQRDGQGLQRLTQTTHTEGSPTWSPDGRRVAFTSNDNGQVHIYIMNADGSGRRRVTTKGTWNDSVSWSPEGSRLIYVKRASGRNDIHICDVSGENVNFRRLTMNQGNNESPSWAPNGTHIIFTSDRTGTWQLYTMLDDGSNQMQLTTTGRNTMPDWGPLPPDRQ